MVMKMINFLELNRNQLINEIGAMGEKPFRAKQIWHWAYQHGVQDFDKMNNVNKNLQNNLCQKYSLSRIKDYTYQQSNDGTIKWLIRLFDDNLIETVYIPEPKRGTLCVSSQVGCTLNCSFCHTGTQKMVKNLSSGEILAQLLFAKDFLSDWPASTGNRKITNIVMMGMGEPLLNYQNVKSALEIFMDPDGIDLSRRRITLSTSGIVPFIEQCGIELGVNLAISLHAVNDDLRDILVPINKKYPIKELLEACKIYANLPLCRNKRITFEYVMLKDVNDSDTEARELVRLLKNIPAKLNLIPFNKWPRTDYECSSKERINKFAEIVMDAGYISPVRKPRGEDILAACGQLKSLSVKMPKAKVNS